MVARAQDASTGTLDRGHREEATAGLEATGATTMGVEAIGVTDILPPVATTTCHRPPNV